MFAKLTGSEVNRSLALVPPFYTDFGKNIHVGKNVFINTGCTIQDQGGVYIGDGAIIAAGAVVTKDVAARTIAAGVPARVVSE